MIATEPITTTTSVAAIGFAAQPHAAASAKDPVRPTDLRGQAARILATTRRHWLAHAGSGREGAVAAPEQRPCRRDRAGDQRSASFDKKL